ncbi:hypothetical protein LCGC14_1360820 [marine sediment metagenome]|uniref:Uncharacterized protein n=1 Tax=marine sediment metagenome TaxID=412755 RepID=A0A0F9K8T1_9ZZZZ
MWEDRLSVMAIGKVKLDAERAPTPTDDTQQGYKIGSEWFDVLNKRQYVCLDGKADAAVWVETTKVGMESTPPPGNKRVQSLFVTPDDKLQVEFEDTPVP